jgi:cell filamentation protein
MSYLQADGATLKNKCGATTAKQLDDLTTQLTSHRLVQLEAGLGPPPTFDTAHLKALHHYIFQDVFEWAGHTRDERIPLADGTTAYIPSLQKANRQDGHRPFANSADIPELLDYDCQLLKAQIIDANPRLGRLEFAKRLADVATNINSIHPFREGNGRTLRAFLSEVARSQGQNVAFDLMTPGENYYASVEGTNGNREPMRDLYRHITDPDLIHTMRCAKLLLTDAPRTAR